MNAIKKFNQKDLVLKVNHNYNPNILDLDGWMPFINCLTDGRSFQKDAIVESIIYLCSGQYSSIEDLVEENYRINPELQNRYLKIENYRQHIQLGEKLTANIDLATGTGKSYVMYGIAQIMLGIGVVDRVLVLCPSLTIEAGLTEKFKTLSSNPELKIHIPEDAVIKNPRIVNANRTIQEGDLCIENIHAVYENTGSSIYDSLSLTDKVLILNDESHHIFNKVIGNNSISNQMKKWKSFLMDSHMNFKYILGFTGTAYIDDEYFNDVIYRYSLRDAIEDRIIKNVDYVSEDDSTTEYERFQKIFQNHQENKRRYSLIKPLTILITRDIKNAIKLHMKLKESLISFEHISLEVADKKTLVVTSDKLHIQNIRRLKQVDNFTDPVEWIISVSMLTEGWDVKNVFQIVPWEDRAFNSKLLVSQVLGRGLRLPPEYQSPQPRVIVFNHKAWSYKISGLVEEVLEIETRISSEIKNDKDYHFDVYNLEYSRKQREIKTNPSEKNLGVNYTRMLNEGIELVSQSVLVEEDTVFTSILGNDISRRKYKIENITWTIEEVIDKIFEEFEQRDWEGRTLQLGNSNYTQYSLPPRSEVEQIIRLSMKRRGIDTDQLIEKNVFSILSAFQTFLRRKNKSVVTNTIVNNYFPIHTVDIEKQSLGIGNLRRDATIFFSSNWRKYLKNSEQISIFEQIYDDQSLPRSALKEINDYLFKTPMNLVFTNFEPERKFVELLCRKEHCLLLDAWIKSRDRGFYSIEYSMRQGSSNSKTRRYSHSNFNPDFFISTKRDNFEYILVVEIKSDFDDSEENKAKYRYSKEHFKNLNNILAANSIRQKYIFHILSPNSFSTFFEYFKDGRLLESQDKFRGDLEQQLEERFED